MNDNDTNKLIEHESFKMLLEEFTKEQEVHNKSLNELVTTVKALSDKFTQLEEKVNNRQPIIVHTDTTAMEKIIKNGITNMQIIACKKTQPVVKKWQLLLFPENAYPSFQKIFMSRWIVFVLPVFLIYCSMQCFFHWSDNQKEIQIQLSDKALSPFRYKH